MPDLEIKPIENLAYEFRCEYRDGSVAEQHFGTPQEIHLGHLDLANIRDFRLIGQGREYSVNLLTGELNLNGLVVSFDLGFRVKEDGSTERIFAKDFTLIYFRRNRIDFLGDGSQERRIWYAIGWQTQIDNENHQRIAMISEDGKVIISTKK